MSHFKVDEMHVTCGKQLIIEQLKLYMCMGCLDQREVAQMYSWMGISHRLSTSLSVILCGGTVYTGS